MSVKADGVKALYAAIESEAERIRIWRPFSGMFWARPKAAKRKDYRERATAAALGVAISAHASRRTPTRFELRNAMEVELSRDEHDEVGGIFVSILISVIVRLVMDWLLRGKPLEPAGQETQSAR